MIVCTAFSHTPTIDHEGKPGPLSNTQLAVRWLDWCARLGGIEETELVMLAPDDFVLPESAKLWRKVTRIKDRVIARGWPYGPNAAFGQLVWAMYFRKGSDEPWLFCEPDCIPLRKGWLAELERAYKKAGKPFMGAQSPAGVNYPEHMTGNAVYPAKAAILAPSLVSEKKMNVAWDIRSASQVLPQMAKTDLIYQLYRHPPFASLEEFQAKVPASAVLFHSDKYGRLIDLLSGDAPSGGEQNAQQPQQEVHSEPVPAPDAKLVQPEPASGGVPVFSIAQLCEVISANIKSETARLKLMGYLHSKRFHQKNFGAALKELAVNGA